MQMPRGEAERRSFFGNTPTLGGLNRDYGNKTAALWLLAQLGSLDKYAGVNKKMDIDQLKELAYLIVGKCYYFKVSELLLFFVKLKSGEYGKFYGVVDPMVIMEALGTFTAERSRAYEQREQEIEKQRLISNENTLTYEEWQCMKAQKASKSPNSSEK